MITTIVILSICLAVSLFYNYRFAMILLRLEDTLEECLDIINEKYAKMSEILSRPLFYDSPEIRKVIEDIRSTKDALHKVAIVLYKNFEISENETDGDVRKEKD